MTLRTNIIVCGSLFAALIGTAIIGNVLQSAGMAPLSGAARYVAMFLFFGLFIACGLSAVPVMVKLVVGAQGSVADASGLVRNQNAIINGMWALMIAGTIIAVPAAIFGGMFGDAPKQFVNRLLAGSSMGTLSARPGMTLDEMVKASTVKLNLQYASAAIAGKGVFEFVVPNSNIKFPRARSYFITTENNDHNKVRVVNISTSPDKGSVAAIDSADAELRAQLSRDGWLTGHEEYRTEQEQQLHGGVKQGAEGRYWLKDGMVFVINRNRMDEAKTSDSAAAGEWIQYIEMWAADDLTGFERFIFQPAKTP